jgi:rubrerythrin
MEISEHELRHLARQVDDQHREAIRDFRSEVADLHLDAAQGSRRRFLARAGAVGVGAAVMTAGGGVLSLGRFGGVASAAGLTDTQIAGYAQSVELAAVAVYTAAAPALKGDTLKVAQLFASHHQDHAEAFGSVAGKDARPTANPKLVAAVQPALDSVAATVAAKRDATDDVLELARTLEDQATYTYAAALTALISPEYAAATSTILPIEAQHATVLAIALGKGAADLFPTGAFESASFGDGTDPKAGLDPAVFA